MLASDKTAQPRAGAESAPAWPSVQGMSGIPISAGFSGSPLNRCNLSPRVISSEEFQANPQAIEIIGVRTSDASLFRRLRDIHDADERGSLFQDYLCEKFALDRKTGRPKAEKTGYSYLNLLRAWGQDSNRQAGAVLKAWVESRFGIPATYHNGRLADNHEARTCFLQDRMRGAAKSVGVFLQLDLLYTFCQDELRRLHPNVESKTLFRGTHDPEEYTLRETAELTHSGDRKLIQLNNLSSFTSDREIAWEFGSSAWAVSIPLAKITFFSGLLSKSLLSGESEYLVLGGYYLVSSMRY